MQFSNHYTKEGGEIEPAVSVNSCTGFGKGATYSDL